jgi:hypothetical protein
MSRKVAYFVVVSPSLVLAAPVMAGPAAPSSQQQPATVDVGPVQTAPQPPPPQAPLYGQPPPQATYGDDTFDQPGFNDRSRAEPETRTYGSSRQFVGPGGEVHHGYQIYDEDLMPNDGGYTDNTPDYHVVQPGDTLWDVSGYYLADPYDWPKVWAWNEHVTNPHWIFPGDRIRLYDPSQGRRQRGDDGPDLRFSKTKIPERARKDSYMLNQIAFVDKDQFETSMKITGGAEAKVMLATLDTAYMSYEGGNPPIPGERLVAYAPTEEVKDIKNRKTIGYLVQIMGEVRVETVAREAAEGTIVNALNPVERGYRVGPLRRVFRRVETEEPDASGAGVIVATLTSTGPMNVKIRKPRGKRDPQVLAGDEQFVIIDLGADDGVKEGNILEVVRKGDEYSKKREWHIPYEDGWPRRVIGTLLAVEVQETTTLCAVTYSARELERGDHVELRGPGLRGEGDGSDRGSMDADANANVESGDGEVKGNAGFSLGGDKK